MIYDGWLKIQDWFHERSLIYDKYSKSIPKKPDVINVDFLNLRYGWLEMVFRINGQKQLMIPLSDLYDPLQDIVQWLVEKPLYFDPFGQTGLLTLAII